MNIRFISTLTAEDENAFAPALLKAASALLDHFPIVYTLRIETTGAQVFLHTHSAADAPRPVDRHSRGSGEAHGRPAEGFNK